MDRNFGYPDRVGNGIQMQFFKIQPLSPGIRRLASELYGNPGQKFFGIKGFGQIIGSAGHQDIDLIIDINFSADNNDRNPLDFGKNRFAGKAGKHQIQKNQIGLAAFQKEKGFRTRISPDDGIAVSVQKIFQHISNINIIVNNCNRIHQITRLQENNHDTADK